MLNVLIRAIILYFFLLAAMRLMGKRQLSEFQPFEFAITLVAADLACIPMSDNTIPIIYGIIPIFTLVIFQNRRDKLRRAGNKRESVRAAKVCKRAGNERRP